MSGWYSGSNVDVRMDLVPQVEGEPPYPRGVGVQVLRRDAVRPDHDVRDVGRIPVAASTARTAPRPASIATAGCPRRAERAVQLAGMVSVPGDTTSAAVVTSSFFMTANWGSPSILSCSSLRAWWYSNGGFALTEATCRTRVAGRPCRPRVALRPADLRMILQLHEGNIGK